MPSGDCFRSIRLYCQVVERRRARWRKHYSVSFFSTMQDEQNVISRLICARVPSLSFSSARRREIVSVTVPTAAAFGLSAHRLTVTRRTHASSAVANASASCYRHRQRSPQVRVVTPSALPARHLPRHTHDIPSLMPVTSDAVTTAAVTLTHRRRHLRQCVDTDAVTYQRCHHGRRRWGGGRRGARG